MPRVREMAAKGIAVIGQIQVPAVDHNYFKYVLDDVSDFSGHVFLCKKCRQKSAADSACSFTKRRGT